MRLHRPLILSLLVLVGLAVPVAAQQAPPMRGIVNITGQLYRAQNVNHYTVFLVTPEGIIMSDPINRDFSRWLKAELATRFKVPVRYVLYTHRDWDHASGGVVFADTAEFVGHGTCFGARASGRQSGADGRATKMDANRNGLIERGEATGAMADQFALLDYNRDNVRQRRRDRARSDERRASADDDLFRSAHGDARRQARDDDPSRHAHADDSSVLHFPDERAVFSADILQVQRLPGGLAPTLARGSTRCASSTASTSSTRSPGTRWRGRRRTPATCCATSRISTGVAAGIAAGRSLAEIQKTLTLDAYKGFERWDTNRDDTLRPSTPRSRARRPDRDSLRLSIYPDPEARHAACAVARTCSRIRTSSSTCIDVNSPSGPRGVRSVKGDS